MIPLPAEVKVWLQWSIWLFYKRLILHANMEIFYLVKSFAGGTCGFSYREDQVVPLRDC